MTDQNVNGTETEVAPGTEEVALEAVDLFADDFDLDSLGNSEETTEAEAAAESPSLEEGNTSENTGPEDQAPASDIPAHLQGKTAEQLVDMVRDLERLKGSQGNELGTLRSQVAELQQFANAHLNRKLDSLDVEDPFADEGRDADADYTDSVDVNDVVSNNPVVQKMAAKLAADEAAAAMVEAESLVENFQEVTRSEGFVKYLKDHPAFMEIAVKADATNDVASAAQLAKAYLATVPAASPVKDEVKEARTSKVENLKGVKSSNQAKPKQGFKASDLRTLMRTDPARYRELMPHIQKAYQEGRVIND